LQPPGGMGGTMVGGAGGTTRGAVGTVTQPGAQSVGVDCVGVECEATAFAAYAPSPARSTNSTPVAIAFISLLLVGEAARRVGHAVSSCWTQLLDGEDARRVRGEPGSPGWGERAATGRSAHALRGGLVSGGTRPPRLPLRTGAS
jgi:hypothetical protein